MVKKILLFFFLIYIAAGIAGADTMVAISGTSFTMGQPGDTWAIVHTVNLSSFYIGKFEVSNIQYCSMLQYALDNNLIDTSSDSVSLISGDTILINLSDPACSIAIYGNTFHCTSGRETFPVTNVTWYGAASYCNWLSLYEGRIPGYDTASWLFDTITNGYHLVTEAQFELAGRINTNDYPWGGTADTTYGNFLTTNIPDWPDGPSPCGMFDGDSEGGFQTYDGASPYGVYDMSGNAWEWLHDLYSVLTTAEDTNPMGSTTGTNVCFRGGGFDDVISSAKIWDRHWGFPGFPRNVDYHSLGFRIALQDTTPPDSVTLYAPERVKENSTRLRWSQSHDLDFNYYKIFQSTQPNLTDTTGTLVTTINNRYQLTYTVSDLIKNTNYYFKIYVYDFVTNYKSEASNETMVTTLDGQDTPTTTLINGGHFIMGDTHVAEPEHRVNLDSYYISTYEITNQQYRDMLQWAYCTGIIGASSDSVWPTNMDTVFELIRLNYYYCKINYTTGIFTIDAGYETYPVTPVTWYGAAMYCNWLSMFNGADTLCYDTGFVYDSSINWYHLPTEAQWEYAALGSLKYIYPWGNSSSTYRFNCSESRIYNATQIGSYGLLNASVFGLYDMAGNVLEWVNDWDTYYYSVEDTNPLGGLSTDTTATYKILRGGGFSSRKIRCRSAYRFRYILPTHIGPDLGFRIAKKP